MSIITYGAPSHVVARGPSPKLWADCPVMQLIADPAKGFYLWDDFKNSVVSKETASGSDFTSSVGRVESDIEWYCFSESTKLTEIALQDDDDGVIHIAQDGSDADVTAIITGFNAANYFHMPLKGERKKFWFEVRFKVSTITDAEQGLFIGFNEKGEAANALGGFAGDAAALDTGNDYLGFAVLEGDGDDLIVVHFEAGAGTAQSSTGAITLVANTYIRVGFRLDVSEDKIRVYADGVDLGDSVAIDITSSNFPSNTDLSILMSVLGASGTAAANIKVDWVRFAQEY